MSELILGGGCFWCTEAVFSEIKGVISVQPGYTGGNTLNPTYADICTGSTGHAEVIKITYDENILNIVDLFVVYKYGLSILTICYHLLLCLVLGFS